jgi:hypothetical protein
LTFLCVGGVGRDDGNWPGGARQWPICTSCAAASILRSSENCSVIVTCCPTSDCEFIESTPAIVENCFSSGVATAEAIVSGLAPGRLRLNLDSREIDVRQRVDGQQPVTDDPEDQDAGHDQQRHHRPANEERGDVQGAPTPPEGAQ